MPADLIVLGRVLHAGVARAPADAVAMVADRIVAVGPEREISSLRGRATRLLGSGRGVIVPGFVDAHVHFQALARRITEVDCSQARARTIPQLLEQVASSARDRPEGEWIRAFGYDECLLAERRAPTTDELSQAAPAHPVRLLHRTGHAAVLNRAALERLGITSANVIYEPGEVLRGKIPALAEDRLEVLAAAASRTLLSRGVTSFHDLTPGQDATSAGRLARWVERDVIRQRVVAYGAPRAAHADCSVRSTPRFRRGGVKIVVTESSELAEVSKRVADADGAGEQVALHAVEGSALVVAVGALARLGPGRTRARGHRIEHASLCPPPLVDEIAACGATIVTHPRFLEEFGEKYRQEIAVAEHDWLYPLRMLRRAGVPVALGSDAPIGTPEPLANVRAAVLRGATAQSEAIGESQAVSVVEALDLHTRGGAVAGGDPEGGRIAIGSPADLVLLDRDPAAHAASEIVETRILATVVSGEVGWSR